MSQQQLVLTKAKYYLNIAMLIVSSNSIAATYDLNELDKDPLTVLDKKSMFDEPSSLMFSPEDFEKTEQQNIKEEFAEILEKIKQKQFDSAHSQVEALIKRQPDIVQAYILRATIELHQKDRKAASASFNKALSIDPKNQAALLGIASIDFDEGRPQQAKERIRQAMAVNKKTVSPYLLLAEIANKEKNLDEAEKALIQGLENVNGQIGDEARLVSSLARMYGIQKQPEKVLKLVQEMNVRYPDHPTALSLLAGAYIVNNRAVEAEQTLRKIIAQNERDIQHRVMLANYLSRQPDKADDVLVLLNQASMVAPDNLQLMVQKANLLIRVKYHEEALKVAGNVAALSPETKLHKVLEGDVYLAQKKFDQAYAAYREAYQARSNPKLLELMVTALSSQGKQADAIKLLNDELKKDDKNVLAHIGLATLFQQQNDLTQAEKHLEAILAIQPKNPIILNNLAWLYHQQNKPEALNMAERAYKVAPNSAEIADTLGAILLKRGEFQKALVLLEKAVNLKPNDPNIQYHLAEVLVAKGDKKRAVELLEVITQVDQVFESKKRAFEMLGQLKSN